MSSIKKWVDALAMAEPIKDRSAGRRLEEGRNDRSYGSIDYSGPIPRVKTSRPTDDKPPAVKIKRGFWAALPGERNGVLFENATTVIKADFKHASGTYVVASFAASFGGSGLSAEKYHDVWYMDKLGKLYINGAPFISVENQTSVASGGLFFPEVSVSNAGVFTYSKKGWALVSPYTAVTQRMVGAAVPVVGQTPLSVSESANMFSTDAGEPIADLPPGWHWTFNRVDGRVWATFVTQGARAVYGGASANNLAPISTTRIEYDFRYKTAVYTHTGGGYTGGYAAPGDNSASITVKPDDPSGVEMPAVVTSGTLVSSGRTETFNPGSNCGTYGGVPDEIKSNFTAAIGGPIVADLTLTPPASDFLTTTPLHTTPVVAQPNTTQKFFGALVNPSFAETGDGKRGSYSNVATTVEWGVSSSIYPHSEYGKGTVPHVSGTSSVAVPPEPSGGHYMMGWTSDLRANPNQVGRGGATHLPGPNAVIPDPRVYHGSDLRRRMFSGTVSKTGYMSECGVDLSTAFGQLSSVDVKTSFRSTSASGTKYAQPSLNYANIPGLISAGNADAYNKLALGSHYTMLVNNDAYGNNCQWSPFWGTIEAVSAYNQQLKTSVEECLTIVEADVSSRTYYYWHHRYADVPYTSSAHSDTRTSGGTRYAFTTKDYLFYNPDFEITIESSLVKDYGAGPDFDNDGGGATAESLTIILNTKYRGTLIDSRTIYSGWPSGYLNFNDKYYGMADGWDSLYDPMNSFPRVTCREPPTGIFPTFCMQECCPFVAFTTSAEVTNGAEPQCYVDMPIVLCAPTSVGDSLTQVRFVPLQLLNNLIWMTAPLEGTSDASVSAYAFLDNLHLHFLDDRPITLRLYSTADTGTIVGSLPPTIQSVYGTNTVNFGRT